MKPLPSGSRLCAIAIREAVSWHVQTTSFRIVFAIQGREENSNMKSDSLAADENTWQNNRI